MPIDPEKIRGGREGLQINVRVSPDAKNVLDYLAFVHHYSSPGQLLLGVVGQLLEGEEPVIRQVLDKPDSLEVDWLAQVLHSLDELSISEDS